MEKLLLPSSQCEAELQELMYQIDKMVQSKKEEWERDLHIVETQLSSKQRECQLLKLENEDKMKELELTREKLHDSNKTSALQITELKNEITNIAKQYEKICRKFKRQEEDARKEYELLRHELENERRKFVADVGNSKSSWESEKQRLQWELEQVTIQKNSALDKLQLHQEQAQSYSDQLEKRKHLSVSAENSLKRHVEQLEKQLASSKEQLSNYANSLEDIKVTLKESTQRCQTVCEEKEQLDIDIKSAKRAIQKLEVENSRLSMEIRRRDDLVKELQNDKLSVESKKLKEHKAVMSEKFCMTDMSITDISYLEEDISELKQRHDDTYKREKVLLDEIDRLSTNSSTELEEHKVKNRYLTDELTKVKDSSSKVIELYKNQISVLRANISQLEDKILRSETEQTGNSETIDISQKKLKQTLEDLETRRAELEVANAQLDALRLENKQLRLSYTSNTSNNSVEFQRLQEQWRVEKKQLIDLLKAAEARAELAEAENSIFHDFAQDVEEDLGTGQLEKLIDGHIAKLRQDTNHILGSSNS